MAALGGAGAPPPYISPTGAEFVSAVPMLTYTPSDLSALTPDEVFINRHLSCLRESSKDPESLTLLFHKILQDLQTYYESTRSPGSGIRRDDKKTTEYSDFSPLMSESLSSDRLNKSLRTQLIALLKTMAHDSKAFSETTKRIEKECHEERFAVEIIIQSKAETRALGWNAYPSPSQLSTAIGEPVVCHRAFAKDSRMMEKLNEHKPSLYRHFTRAYEFSWLERRYKSPTCDIRDDRPTLDGDLTFLKSHFVIVSTYLSTFKGWEKTTEYLTWLNLNEVTDPIRRFELRPPPITSIHSDFLSIEPLLEKVSSAFARAIQWDPSSETLDELKSKVALHCYLFIHSYPFYHGSSAAMLIFEKILYGFHGFKVCHLRSQEEFLLGLATLFFDDYLKEYNKTIKLE